MKTVKSSNTTINKNFDFRANLEEFPIFYQLKEYGLWFLKSLIDEEVKSLCGTRYSRGKKYSRWGFNPGAIFFEDEKIKIKVPRIINKKTKTSHPLERYEQLRNPLRIEKDVFGKILHGISTRDYQKAIIHLLDHFAISKSTLSRRFLNEAERRLEIFNNRSLKSLDIVAIFLDGKRFAESGLIIALGVDLSGVKHYLGFIESSSENSTVMEDFFKSLRNRELNFDKEILFVIDGAPGMSKAIRGYFKEKGFIQRCQWHKRKNVLSYLPKKYQEEFRLKIQRAYEKSSYKDARDALLVIHKELKLINKSAANSLEEGFEETLTLHRLNLFDELGRSFKTTNVLESVNRQIQKYGHRVTRWRSSLQLQVRVASILLETENNLSKVCGHNSLSSLREQMERMNNQSKAA